MSDEKRVLELVPRTTSGAVEVNHDAVLLIEGVLERLKSGKSVAVAVVEVLDRSDVACAFSRSTYYHQLNSGAARLAARLAAD